MRVLVVGAGGVGAAFAAIAQRRPAFEHVALADVSPARVHEVVAGLGEADRFSAERVDASDRAALAQLIGRTRPDAVLNACDPRFNEPIFDACFEARVTYVDMAMTLSHPHPQRPHELPGVMLGDLQLARSEQWKQAGLLALVGMGVEPGLSDVFARHAADELFESIQEIGVRDGADLVVEGYDFAPTFSIWTTIEECLNPPLIWERERGFYTTPPFSEPELFKFPEGIGEVECVNVEHEEVVLIPRWVDCERVTFKYGLGEEFIEVLKTLHKLGLDATEPVSVRSVPGPASGGAGGPTGAATAGALAGAATAGGPAGGGGLARVAPRDVVAATLPDPAKLGERMTGRTCAGTWVRGTGRDGQPRSTYLYHVVDNEQTMREYGSQAVVWQTAVNPVVALELLDAGVWKGAGVLGPEAFAPEPFLQRLAELGAPHGQVEMPLASGG
jgi:saccharopine dehydrogenase (NAD+, L-lysine forming)